MAKHKSKHRKFEKTTHSKYSESSEPRKGSEDRSEPERLEETQLEPQAMPSAQSLPMAGLAAEAPSGPSGPSGPPPNNINIPDRSGVSSIHDRG